MLRIAIGFAFFTLLFVPVSGFAKTYAKPAVANLPTEIPCAPATVTAAPKLEAPNFQFKFQTGVSLLSGLQADFGYGFQASYLYRTSDVTPIYFGMDMGMDRWNARYQQSAGEGANKITATGSADITLVHILASMYYRFVEYGASKAHPYIGLSVGPTLVNSASDKIQLGDQPLLNGNSIGVKLEVLLRPGVDIAVTKEISVDLEPQVGILNGFFLFSPRIGVAVSF